MQVPIGKRAVWIRCDSQHDAQQMAGVGNLASEVLERKRLGADVAEELSDASHLFLKYCCTDRAAWLVEHAEVGEGRAVYH